jgi:hypothetical protein
MPTNNFDNITGSLDGKVPVHDANGRWTQWSLAEIFNGTVGQNRYIPKLRDWVVDIDLAKYWRVTATDPTTGISTLSPIIIQSNVDFGPYDQLLGVGPGTQSDTYRCYIDQSVLPHTLAVDARLMVGGSMTNKAKIFKGSDLNGTGEVVSGYFDQMGTLLTQDILLELATLPPNNQLVDLGAGLMTAGANLAIRVVPVCYTTHNLADNELVTIVFYSDTGTVVSKRQLMIENTAFIRNTELGQRQVVGISLESPFLSNTEPKLLQYPLNVPVNGLSMIGVVHYNSGPPLRLPVDGTKFSVWGLERFVSTIVGQKFDLVLNYRLSPGETMVGGNNSGNGSFFSESYSAQTINADGSFTNKLFGYPVWIDGVNGYRMEWFLYSLERAAVFRVTPYVRFNPNTPAFNPTAYGVQQTLSLSLTLKDANGSLPAYVHTQAVTVTLLAAGTARSTNWKIGYTPSQNPMYGIGVFASSTFVNQNLWKLKIDSGFATQAEWLTNLYYRTLPLTDETKETAPPVPNFFKIVIGTNETEYPISQWNTEQIYNTAIPNNGTVFIKFFLRLADNDIQLAVAGMPIYQSN